jgi:hypothetical protein
LQNLVFGVPAVIAHSIWPYCKTHKVKWLAGWDLSLPEVATNEQRRRFDELGMSEFKHIYREETESLAADACDDPDADMLDDHAMHGANDDETD